MSAKAKGERKHRKQENIRFIVKWIENNTIYFRAYKRDSAAVEFQQYLIDDGIPPEMIRIHMK